MSEKIENDQQLRAALNSLNLEQQRQLGAHFIANVAHLSYDPSIKQGLLVIENPERTSSELENAYKTAKKLSIDTYTSCGRDADWATQAEHFVAAALTACLLPEEQVGESDNLAWKAAMQVRMAKNCEMILKDQGELASEAGKQYEITSTFLQ